jgi:hypothetical protein
VRLIASRRMLLYHADALVLREQISLEQGQDAGDEDPVGRGGRWTTLRRRSRWPGNAATRGPSMMRCCCAPTP